MNSLDVNRVLQAAAARHQRMNWVARWSLRWIVRLRRWRERIRQWGRGRAAPAAPRAAADLGEKPPA